MGNALLAGVSGLKAHQMMLDVAGNNLANINTTAFKSSSISFVDLLSTTLSEASQPTSTIGGTNPQQIGSGVKVASIDRNMSQGSLVNTGESLDMAIEGSGYFVLNDGKQDVYTRMGSFAVDSEFYLVDPGTGYRVQRIGSEGVDEGFQTAASNAIRVPYDAALEARATETVTYTGNLDADASDPTSQLLSSGLQYTANGAAASTDTLLKDLDQVSGLVNGDSLTIDAILRDGTEPANVDFDITDIDTQTVGEFVTAINAVYGSDTTVSIINGEIRIKDTAAGYSQTDLKLSCSREGAFTLPKHFDLLSAGGEAVKNANIEIYDSQGINHVMSAAFVRSESNTWDLVITSITGGVELVDRRIKDISFQADGSFGGLSGTTPDTATLQMKFAHDPNNTRTLTMNLGTIGDFDGLTQFGESSTATASDQSGYASGTLSDISVTREGVMMGIFTNGVRKEVAALKIATFQNPEGLQAIGNNYYEGSANSGNPVPTKALAGGAGAIHGGSLEQSNVDVASEFVNLIQAQNGYQANARTITVTNEMLQELTNLIR